MCVMDTRERALIRQSGLPEIILSAKYPVCVLHRVRKIHRLKLCFFTLNKVSE